MAIRRKKIRVKYRKLGREGVWGQADDVGIELDERLNGKKHLEILIHEAMHILHPKLGERDIIEKSISLTNLIWGEKYRRPENDESMPLQDGRK